MHRACRLVADTGIHYFGWSHEEAFQLFLDNTALSELFITNEVRRYITWPGQVCISNIIYITLFRKKRKFLIAKN